MGEEQSDAARRLQDAFEAFNQVGSQLNRSYRALEEKVARLTTELAEARSEKLEQLREKERLAARLEDLIEALPGGLLVVDACGVVREANQAACALLGGNPCGRLWEAVAADSFVERDEALELADGTSLSLSSSALGEGGERVILLSDITETRRLQGLLARRERLAALGETAARLAHQIRTPLASVLLYLSQLDDPSLDGARRSRFVGRARERLRHLEQTVDNMLAYARGGEVHPRPVSLAWLAEQFAQIMEAELASRDGFLEVELRCGDAELHGDGDALLGVLVNLGTNALEACGKAPRLVFRARRQGKLLRLALEDNGPGVPPELREKVFEPFFTTRANGTGLGLAVARAVVENHGGRLALEEAAGGGTRVILELPLEAAPAALPSGSRAAGDGAGEGRLIMFGEKTGVAG